MDGRVAIVTGASRGIGQRIAERLAAEGAAVALVARTLAPGTSRLPGSLEEVADRIRAGGGKAEVLTADLTAPDDVETVLARAEEALGPVDTLVNNAGVNFYGPALDVRPSRYEVMYAMMAHAVPALPARGARHGGARPGLDTEHHLQAGPPPAWPAVPRLGERRLGTIRDVQGGA